MHTYQINTLSFSFKFLSSICFESEGSSSGRQLYRSADKSLARPTSRCTSILFDGECISFDASLVIQIKSTDIQPIMIINRIYEHQNLLSM
jgi:hypothetical protein